MKIITGQSEDKHPVPRRHQLTALLILLLAAIVRLWALDRIPPGLWYDEAIYALDGLDVSRGHFPIFFTTEGHPREPLYIYSLGGFFALFGHSTYNARIVSALWGILTVAAFYPVSRRIFTPQWSLAATFAFATFRWHVHFSRTIFRAMLPPLFILLVILFFQRWREKRRPTDAAFCGFFMGAGLYTYLSFRFVPIIFACWVGWLLAKRVLIWRRDWKHLLLIAGTAFIVFLPLGLDYVQNPWHFSGRMDEVSMFTKETHVVGSDGKDQTKIVPKSGFEAVRDLAANARDIALMWLVPGKGDHVGKHNLPYEPVFDLANGVIFWAGIVWCLLNVARNEYAFLMLTWISLISMTSVFSFGAPNLLRMQGETPAVIIAYIFGLRWLTDSLARVGSRKTSRFVAAAMLAYFAANQLWVYFVKFPASPAVRMEFNTDVFYEPGTAALKIAPNVKKVYVPRETADHATFRFVTAGIPNIEAFSQAGDFPTTSTRPFAVLTTTRAEELALKSHNDLPAKIAGLQPVHKQSFSIVMPPSGNSAARRIRWGDYYLVP